MGGGTSFTVTSMVSGALSSVPSLTMSWNVRISVLLTVGVVNVGSAAVSSDNVTVVPPVCIHEYVKGSLSASVLPVPLSVTVVSSSTD